MSNVLNQDTLAMKPPTRDPKIQAALAAPAIEPVSSDEEIALAGQEKDSPTELVLTSEESDQIIEGVPQSTASSIGLLDRVRFAIDPTAKQDALDRAMRARKEFQLDLTIAAREKELQDLSDGPDGIQPTIIGLNQKGGAGKSPNETSSAVTIAAVTDQTVVIVDNNQVLGSTLQYLDIKTTLGVRDSMKKFSENTSSANVIRYLGHHPKYRNIYGVNSDTAAKRAKSPIDVTEFFGYAKGLKSACHTLIFDNGNEVINAQTLVGIELADVLRFVAIPWVNDATRLCRDTMEEIGDLYSQKVDDAVITVSACYKEDMNLNYWAKYFNHPKEQICLIPYDPIFEPRMITKDGSPEREVWVVDHEQFKKETYLANLERDILTFKQAQKGIERKNGEQESTEEIIARINKFLQEKANEPSRQAIQEAAYKMLNPAS
jgi:hypothetical protein